MAALRILGIDHTGITVSDIDRSIAFYRDVLGFEVSEKIPCRGELFEKITGVPGAEIEIAYVTAPGHQIELLCYRKPADRLRSNLRPCDSGSMHLTFKVEDIDAVVEAARACGFVAVNPVQTVMDGPRKGLRGIYTRDPDGVVLEFLEYPKD